MNGDRLKIKSQIGDEVRYSNTFPLVNRSVYPPEADSVD